MRDVYLITGATGFIGSNLVRRLVSQNKKVAILTRAKKLNWRLESLKGSIGVYECDLLDKKLPKVIQTINPDYIFHLASTGENQTDAIKNTYDTNCLGTVNLIEALKLVKFKLFINCGSFEENYQSSHFAISKSTATAYCTREAQAGNLPIITIRRPTAYGYFDCERSPICALFLSRITKNKIGRVEGTYSRDIIFIDDLIEAYIQSTVQNIKKGSQLDIYGEEVIDSILLKRIIQKWEKRKGLDDGWDKNFAFDSIIRHNPNKKQALKWESSTKLSQGLVSFYEWLAENKKYYL